MSVLRDLAETARETVESGYYRRGAGEIRPAPSLVKAVRASKERHGLAVVAEVNLATTMRSKPVEGGHEALMEAALEDGACALSVVTEPRRFHGNLSLLRSAVATRAPTVMNDFIVSEVQIDCAAAYGASAIVLLPAMLPRSRVPVLIDYAHVADREVILECANRVELEAAQETEADLLALSSRDLATFRVEPERALGALEGFEGDRPVMLTGGAVSAAQAALARGRADAIVVNTTLLSKELTVAGLLASRAS